LVLGCAAGIISWYSGGVYLISASITSGIIFLALGKIITLLERLNNKLQDETREQADDSDSK
jgi:hypothetical protein